VKPQGLHGRVFSTFLFVEDEMFVRVNDMKDKLHFAIKKKTQKILVFRLLLLQVVDIVSIPQYEFFGTVVHGIAWRWKNRG